MDIELIKMFNVALSDEKKVDFKTLNEEAIQSGYIVHPDACTESVKSFIAQQYTDVNSTFYKTWLDITSKNRLELLIDQIQHYASTYGTGFTGDPYIPNNRKQDIPNLKNYKIIMPITREGLLNKCVKMLSSSIALKSEVVFVLVNYLYECNFTDVDSLTNKEAICYLCAKSGIFPKDKFNLFRYIIYHTTNCLLIINNDELIQRIIYSSRQFDFHTLSDEQLIALSSIFFRFKNLFLAFKKCNGYYRPNNAPIINKLRRLAKKNHEPFKEPAVNHIISGDLNTINDFMFKIKDISSFKLISLMQACLLRLKDSENSLYFIRNQKVFLRENYHPNIDKTYLEKLYNFLESEISNRIATKVLANKNHIFTVKTKKGLHVALPTSEKNFIGNYPFGTYYNLSEHNYICCYWREEWGARDYDLSLINSKGDKIGWNSDYNKDQIVYSGDMTVAKPEASEVIYFPGKCLKGLLKVNLFSGEENSKFRLLIGQENIQNLTKNYMVDPNSIKFSTDIYSDSYEKTIGIVGNDKIILSQINSGNRIVSYIDPNGEKMMDALLQRAECSVSLEEIFKDSCIKLVGEDYTGEVDMDLANLNKDDLIKILS